MWCARRKTLRVHMLNANSIVTIRYIYKEMFIGECCRTPAVPFPIIAHNSFHFFFAAAAAGAKRMT